MLNMWVVAAVALAWAATASALKLLVSKVAAVFVTPTAEEDS